MVIFFVLSKTSLLFRTASGKGPEHKSKDSSNETELQMRGGFEDNSKIIFLIFQ